MAERPHSHRHRRRSWSPRALRLERAGNHRSRSPVSRALTHAVPSKLPYDQAQLRKEDLNTYRNLFTDYLDIQKRLDISTLDREEVKGRWKAFVKKWNNAGLAEGWYDPARQAEAANSAPTRDGQGEHHERSDTALSSYAAGPQSDDDEYGPARPATSSASLRQGPAAAKLQDLQYKRELEDGERQMNRELHKHERQHERMVREERLNELAPRADPGTVERRREKRLESSMSNRAYAEAKDAGAADVNETDLMGDEGVEGYKAKLKAIKQHKNERELRKEEVLRARAAEREEKIAEHRAKEEKTMQTLRALAQQRFG